MNTIKTSYFSETARLSHLQPEPCRKKTRHITSRQRIVLSRFIVAVILLPVLLLTRSAWQELSFVVEEILFSLGVILIGLCVIGRIWCLAYIGGRKNGELVTKGPYSLTRNPLYFFSFIGSVGLGLCSESFAIALLFGAMFLVVYHPVIRSEEARLESLFGEKFRDYVKFAPRFFPRPGAYDVGETSQQLHIRPFVSGLTQVAWFVAAIALLSLIDRLHHEAVLPFLIKLY